MEANSSLGVKILLGFILVFVILPKVGFYFYGKHMNARYEREIDSQFSDEGRLSDEEIEKYNKGRDPRALKITRKYVDPGLGTFKNKEAYCNASIVVVFLPEGTDMAELNTQVQRIAFDAAVRETEQLKIEDQKIYYRITPKDRLGTMLRGLDSKGFKTDMFHNMKAC